MTYENLIFCNLIKYVVHSNWKFVSDVYDWDKQVFLFRKHNMLPLFLEVAVKFPGYLSRKECTEEICEAMTIVASQTKRTSAFLLLYKAFLDKGIYPLVMKGLICRQLYGDLCDHRPSSDEDILVRIEDFWKVKDILEANGYFPREEVNEDIDLEQVQEVTFINQAEQLHIELHLNPMGRENDARSQMSDCFKDVFDDYIEMDIQGVRVRTMSHQNHFTFLILHALRHFLGGGIGVRQMLDILLYHEKYGQEIDMDKLEETLQRFKAVSFWCDLVHIGNKYLGFNLPTRYESCCAEELLEDMMSNGVFGNDTDAKRIAERTMTFSTGNYLQDKRASKFSMLWKSAFPNKEFLYQQAPYLQKNPWLLPVAWVRRWLRFLKLDKARDENLMKESFAISQRRSELLKKYEIM